MVWAVRLHAQSSHFLAAGFSAVASGARIVNGSEDVRCVVGVDCVSIGADWAMSSESRASGVQGRISGLYSFIKSAAC